MSGEKGLGLKSWISGPGRKGTEAPVILDHRRIAVLPFASMSPNPDDEYFADGMTEEVISTLSRVPEIEVISRTSVMQYKKNPRPVKEVSRELGVGTVLEGGVRKAGNHLRITVQMIDASKDRNLWSESYDRELHDVFAIQSEVASKVAEALKIKPESQEVARKSPTASTEAYTLYLKGRFHWNKRGLEEIKTALDYFEQSVHADPSFAKGFVGIADCHELLATNWQLDVVANREKAKSMVTKALALDANMAEARATRGLVMICEFRLRDAAEELKKALALNPSYAPAHLWYYQLLLARQEFDLAREHIEKAVELDPLSANMHLNYGAFYTALRDYSAGLALIKRAVDLDPNLPNVHAFLGAIYGLLKMFGEAKAEFDIATKMMLKTYPRIEQASQAYLALFEDNVDRIRRLLPDLESNPQEALLGGLEIANFYFRLGEQDKGFGWLERACANKDQSLLEIRNNPFVTDAARADPRYKALLNKMQLD